MDRHNSTNATLYHTAHKMSTEIATNVHINQYADNKSLRVMEDMRLTPTDTYHTTKTRVIQEAIKRANRATKDAQRFLSCLGSNFNTKDWWTMQAWHQCPKTFQLDKDYSNYTISMETDGQQHDLPFKAPTQAERTIEYRLAMSEQANTEIQHLQKMAEDLTSKATIGGPSQDDKIRMYLSVMTPGRLYALIPRIIKKNQIDNIQTEEIPLLLQYYKICSTSQRSIVHGPHRYGCVEQNRWSAEILAKQATRLITDLYNNDCNGRIIQCVTSCVQRDICSKTPFMALNYKYWGFLTQTTRVILIWERLSEHGITLHGGWTHPLQWQNDQHLGNTIKKPKQRRQSNLAQSV